MSGKSEYKNKYAAENYDRFSLMLPKGGKEVIKKAAEQSGTESINKYITNAVNTQLVKDGFEPIAKKSEEK